MEGTVLDADKRGKGDYVSFAEALESSRNRAEIHSRSTFLQSLCLSPHVRTATPLAIKVVLSCLGSISARPAMRYYQTFVGISASSMLALSDPDYIVSMLNNPEMRLDLCVNSYARSIHVT